MQLVEEVRKLTDLELLKEKIKDSGMTMVAIAKKTGILRETIYNRLNGRGEFTASEITALTDTLNLTRDERDAIFFGMKVESNATQVDKIL